ncbi:hypothetical protein WJX81_004800 [Elliptochloris bilobata]|uniref:Leucine carboxyl methyltransferase 1 homolog n=1 Tax=Elliptochloris bilobata TaxID=381761 RepID=A0AAW1QTQ1_9CHLO
MAGGDMCVQLTNDDAQISKMSCIERGYFQDNFLHFFVRRRARRSPLINRGYYSRVMALRNLLYQFLGRANMFPGQPLQVLSLGAGYDTTFFQLEAQGLAPARFYEVDLREVTQRKAATIAAVPDLRDRLGASAAVDAEAGIVSSERYSLLPADLREPEALAPALRAAGLDEAAPTFVLAECVLVYLAPEEGAALVRCLGALLRCAAFVLYEQIRPDDAFGQQMVRNLESRGCPLRGLPGTPDLEAQRRRFTDNAWQRAEAADMDIIHRCHLDPIDRQRAERLEIFDEFEEWHLIQAHYCIAVGINDDRGFFQGVSFPKFPQRQLPGRALPNAA